MKPHLVQLGVAIAVALAALAGYTLWYGAVKQLDADAASVATEIAAKDAARARTVSARSAEAGLAEQEAFVAGHLVAPADIVPFLERLEKAGKEFGASVHIASVSDQAAASDGRLSLSLSVTGSFDAVMRTLGAIEQGTYAIAINDLSLNTSDQATWSATGLFVVGTASAPLP